MEFEGYLKQDRTDGDSYPPSDHLGRPLIIKVVDCKHIDTTQYKPEGGDAVIVNLVDLTDGQIYRDVLWMGGAVVDGLRRHVGGKPVVVRFATAQSKAGRTYVDIDPGSEADITLAQSYVTAKGDPFPAQFANAPAQSAQPNWGAPAPATVQPAQGWAPAPAAVPAAAPGPWESTQPPF